MGWPDVNLYYMTKKSLVIIGLALAGVVAFLAVPSRPAASGSMDGDQQKASYALGVTLATSLNRTNPDLDWTAVRTGVTDALNGKFVINLPDLKAMLSNYNKERTAGQTESDWGSFHLFSRFKSGKARISYAFGEDAGLAFSRIHMSMIPGMIEWGMKDALSGGVLRMSSAEISDTLVKFYRDWGVKRVAERKAKAEENQKKEDAFLAANAQKPGVVTLPCGVQYKVLTDGTGEVPELGNYVVLKYVGKKLDGTEFSRNTEPLGTYAMGGILRGWSEALQQMKAGSKWEVYVPARYAYGEDGATGVEPNETLVYEMELVQVLQERPPVITTND